MSRKVFVVGVGMTKFVKPSPDGDYPEMGREAAEGALADCGLPYSSVQQAVCGYVFGDSTCGQRVLYQLGMTGLPIFNVNNNCATGSSALFLANQIVQGGGADCVLALGFEKMSPGALTGGAFTDRTNPMDRHTLKMADIADLAGAPMTAQYFGNAALEHMKKYGTTELHLAKIAAKNHRHGSKNPRSQSKRVYTVEEVLNSRKIYGPLTKLECCPTSDGAAAAVVVSEDFVIRHNLQNKAVEIIAMEMATDTPEVFTKNSLMKIAGYDMTALAARRIYEKTGISPKQVDVVELHDCFAANELITYEGLQLCGEGEAGKFIDANLNTYGGQVVVNPSGGLISKGHPLGATGLAQCAELVWQLRGEAGERQADTAEVFMVAIVTSGASVVRPGACSTGFDIPGQLEHVTNDEMPCKVFVVGVGMTPFVKPGPDNDYPEMGRAAAEDALADCGLPYSSVQQAVCGYVFGDSTCGQRVLYQLGMTGLPIFNVNNNCSTGSSALFLAKQIVQGGSADCVLALGFEKMSPGALGGARYKDRSRPTDRHIRKMWELVGLADAPLTPQYFGNAALEHFAKYGTTELHLAKIAAKNHLHGSRNPRAQGGRAYTVEEVLASRRIYGPLTKLECCPTSDGAGAAVVVSEDFVIRHNLQNKAVEIIGMEMATDTPEIFTGSSPMKIAGYDMTALAAKRLYEKTGISPKQIDVVELHDCFAANELITYEGLQLCGEGEAGKFIDAGLNTYGGQVVVNPSGGLIAKGHPLGATGLAQCAELVWQLRGEAGERQVPKARIALQHNLGLGGAVVITMYRKGFQNVTANPTAVAGDPTDFKVFKYMKILEEAMASDEEKLIEKVRGIYGFKVRNGPNGAEGYWVINAKEGKGKVTYNGSDKPDVTFTINDEDVADLISGKLNPQKAFFQGKIKIQGNMGLAMKLTDLQRQASGRIEAIRSKL